MMLEHCHGKKLFKGTEHFLSRYDQWTQPPTNVVLNMH